MQIADTAERVRDRLKGINLYLIGMMGSGKTTVGRELASTIGYGFCDTDAVIEKVAGQSINDIFKSEGEQAFRELESKVLGELSAYTRLAIATGGGIVLRRENWSYLQQGLVVWLDVPVEILLSRLAGDITRPLLQVPDPAGELQTRLAQRQRLYAQADLRITVTHEETPAQIAARIIETIPTVLKPPINPEN
ncbi:shikimate kinase [Microseira wollei]|uniref:Shikimate kinase n=1 Tax=Microseira wollei NIES-4236 TaxID=2530354 RepID=A0AAV3XN54_9CYAN|nr:shikimate kinase [Microseira wollei]GET43743.1 shikimate kinase [Microseira wollei NIES-4236]